MLLFRARSLKKEINSLFIVIKHLNLFFENLDNGFYLRMRALNYHSDIFFYWLSIGVNTFNFSCLYTIFLLLFVTIEPMQEKSCTLSLLTKRENRNSAIL